MRGSKKILSLVIAIAVSVSAFVPQINVYAAENKNILSTVNVTDVRPQDDFYEAVNGEWIKDSKDEINELYSEKSMFGDIKENNNKITRQEFEDFISDKNKYGEDSDERKMADFYLNYLNIEERNSQGIEPLKKYINKIDSVNDMNSLRELVGDSEIDILTNLIQFDIQVNPEGNAYEAYIEPTSLSMLDSKKYSDDSDSSNKEYKSKVGKFYKALLKQTGYDDKKSEDMCNELFEFEEMLADSILSSEADRSNLDKSRYDISMTLERLDEIAPNIEPSKIMKLLKIDTVKSIRVSQMDWLKKLNDIWTSENLNLIKNYLKVNTIKAAGRYLSEDMDKLYFDFLNELVGMDLSYDSMKDEAYDKINVLFPVSLGKLFKSRVFTDEEKEDVKNIADKIMENYKKRINNCSWLDDTTKTQFIEKLNKINVNIGYSNSNQDYSSADIKLYSQGGNLLDNVMSLAMAAKNNQIKVLNSEFSKNQITNLILPQDVIAEYHILNNTIVITPGILQPEMYDINYSKEKKMAGIGFVIAHEISHSLDVIGAFFDGNGEVKNMWTEENFQEYKKRVVYIRDYYNLVEGFPGKYIDGTLTVCENIADIEGIACIMDLLSEYEDVDYKLFFETYAKIYRSVKTDEAYEYSLENDEHSPDKARVNVVLSQFQKFYDTYGIKEGDKMYVKPEYRITPLW